MVGRKVSDQISPFFSCFITGLTSVRGTYGRDGEMQIELFQLKFDMGIPPPPKEIMVTNCLSH